MIPPLGSPVPLHSLHFHSLQSFCQTLSHPFSTASAFLFFSSLYPVLITFSLFIIFIFIPSSILFRRRLRSLPVTMRYQYCKKNHWRLLMFNHSHKFLIPLIHLHGLNTHAYLHHLSNPQRDEHNLHTHTQTHMRRHTPRRTT